MRNPKDVAAALRKLHGKKLMSFYGGRRAAARATKNLVKSKPPNVTLADLAKHKTTPISQWPDDALVEDVPKRLAKQKTTEVKR